MLQNFILSQNIAFRAFKAYKCLSHAYVFSLAHLGVTGLHGVPAASHAVVALGQEFEAA